MTYYCFTEFVLNTEVKGRLFFRRASRHTEEWRISSNHF